MPRFMELDLEGQFADSSYPILASLVTPRPIALVSYGMQSVNRWAGAVTDGGRPIFRRSSRSVRIGQWKSLLACQPVAGHGGSNPHTPAVRYFRFEMILRILQNHYFG